MMTYISQSALYIVYLSVELNLLAWVTNTFRIGLITQLFNGSYATQLYSLVVGLRFMPLI